jgi:hypothetical protein
MEKASVEATPAKDDDDSKLEAIFNSGRRGSRATTGRAVQKREQTQLSERPATDGNRKETGPSRSEIKQFETPKQQGKQNTTSTIQINNADNITTAKRSDDATQKELLKKEEIVKKTITADTDKLRTPKDDKKEQKPFVVSDPRGEIGTSVKQIKSEQESQRKTATTIAHNSDRPINDANDKNIRTFDGDRFTSADSSLPTSTNRNTDYQGSKLGGNNVKNDTPKHMTRYEHLLEQKNNIQSLPSNNTTTHGQHTIKAHWSRQISSNKASSDKQQTLYRRNVNAGNS